MKSDNEFDKQVDLEPSEFGPGDRPQPFWGINAKYTAIMFLASFPISAIAARIVYGQWPYWLRSFLE